MKDKPRSSPIRLVPMVGLLLVVVTTLFGLSSCTTSGYSGQTESLTLAVPPLEQNALIYVADDRGFFAANGLNVTIKNYDSGVTSIAAMVKGEADLAEAAEFPTVSAILNRQAIGVIVANDKFENDYLIGRKDRGIEKVSDLKGKRIGVARQTINEFYLGRFLELNGINLSQVTLVDLKPAQFVSAIVGGDVDAIIAWQPCIHQIQQKQSNLVTWPAQNSQAVFGLVLCRNEWLAQHGNTVERFITALNQAQDYTVAQPDQAKAIVQKRLDYDSSYVTEIWPQHHFSLSLDFSLIAAMTDEARWIMNNGIIANQTVPDFRSSIYTAGLKSVKPDAVNIVR